MRRSISIFLLCAGISAILWPQAVSEPSTLKDLRYRTVGNVNRIVMTFDGEIRNTLEQSPKMLTLRFAQTFVGPKLGAAKMKFRDGLVQGVNINRLGAIGVEAIVMFRDGAEYSVSTPQANVLWIDVVRSKHQAAAPPPANQAVTMPTKKSAVKDAAKPTAKKTAPTVARIKAEALVAHAPAAFALPAQAPVAASTPIQAEQRSTSMAGTILFATLVLSSMGGLIWRMKTTSVAQKVEEVITKREVIAEPESSMSVQQLTLALAAESAERAAVTVAPSVTETVVVESDESSEAEKLAASFKRGRAEIAFAQHVRKQSTRKVKKANSESNQGGTVEAVAKKLKTGKGEVSLAMHLKEFEQRHHKVEQSHD